MTADKKTCFVLMPFAQEFNELYHAAILPSIETFEMKAIRADAIQVPGSITEQIYREVGKADAIVAVISRSNANVFYELGIAHTLGKPVILASDEIDRVPFDLRSLRVIQYKVTLGGVQRLRDDLSEALTQVLGLDPSSVRSPVSAALPDLDLVPRSELQAVSSELQAARERLEETERQLKTLSKDPEVGSVLEREEELKAFFIEALERLAMSTERDLARATLELEQLREQQVCREGSNLLLTNNYHTTKDLSLGLTGGMPFRVQRNPLHMET